MACSKSPIIPICEAQFTMWLWGLACYPKKFLGPYSANYNYHTTSLPFQIQLGSGQCIEDTVTLASFMKR